MSSAYGELADLCRRKNWWLELGVGLEKAGAGRVPGRDPETRIARPHRWWLRVRRTGGPSETGIVAGAEGPIDRVLGAIARDVHQQLRKERWA